MGIVQRLADAARARLSGFPQEWLDRDRLADWEAGHANPNGDVWAVTPPTGQGWRLWAPGSVDTQWPYPYEGVDPAATSDIDLDRDVDLADVEPWMRPWIEEVSGGRVVEMVEGLAWFGPGHALCEYVIYVRVAS